jgi:hypothetical protein
VKHETQSNPETGAPVGSDQQCKAFKRRTIYGTNVLCHKPATHEVVTTGRSGERLVHSRRCETHAKDLASRFGGAARLERTTT